MASVRGENRRREDRNRIINRPRSGRATIFHSRPTIESPRPKQPHAQPPPPSIASKPPPTGRPPPVLMVNHTTNRFLSACRALINLDSNSHPVLLPTKHLTPSMRISSLRARTGLVNTPLPVLGDPSEQIPHSPETLRATAEGIRLEITPSAMLLREPP